MKRMLIGTMMAVAFAAVTAAQTATPPPPPPQAQQQQPPPQSTAKPMEVTLVGCVVRGTTPKTFLFENAVDPAKKDEKARTFVLVATPQMDLVPHVNHKIQLVGLAETKVVTPVPPATTVAEKDLPTFTIKTITHVADTCSELGR
ncbi:MAG TPA: hypothetical protein VH679_16225 [Vicinamibacterales bacterium]